MDVWMWVVVFVVFNVFQYYQFCQYRLVLRQRGRLLTEFLNLATRTGQTKAFVEDALWRAYPELQEYCLRKGDPVPSPSASGGPPSSG
jgi:hypothetical protein